MNNNPLQNYLNSFAPQPMNPNQPPNSIGGFLGSVVNNAKGVGNSVIGAPAAFLNDLRTQQQAAKSGDTQTVQKIMQKYQPTNVLLNTANSFAHSLYKDIGSPLSGGDILGRAGQNFYDRPVSTALDAAVAIPAVKGLTGVADTAGGLEAANTETNLPQIAARPLPPEPPSMITKTSAAPDVVAKYNSIFQVPRNVAQNMSIKPQTVISQLIKDGVTNVKSIDDLQTVANNVTGEHGAFPTINRTMLNDIKSPVDYSVAKDSVIPAINKYLEGSPQGLQNTVLNQVERAMPKYNDPISSGVVMPENGAYAADLFDTTQELGSLQKMYDRKAYTVMGDLTNPEYERAAQAIGDVKNNIQDILDSEISPERYQAYKQDPRIVAQLKRLPPALAQRYIDGANRFQDGRTIQAPYVGLQNMIDHTKDAQLTASTKLMNQLGQRSPSSDLVDNVANFIKHPIATTTAAVVKKGLSPILDKTPEDLMQEKTSGESASLRSGLAGSVPLSGLPVKLFQAGLTALKGANLIDNSNYENNGNQANQGNTANQEQYNPSNHTGGSIPYSGANVKSSSYTTLKLDPSTGYMELPQTAPPGQNNRQYMSTGDYQSQLQALGAKYTYGTPAYNTNKTQLDAQFANDQKQADEVFKGNNVKNFMDNAVQYNNDGKNLQDTLASLPPAFWNGLSKAGSIRAYNDPQFAQELQQIDKFNNDYISAMKSITGETPTENQLLSSANSQGQAAAKYLAMMQDISGTYGKYLSPYLALTSATGSQTQQGTPVGLPYIPPALPQAQDWSGLKMSSQNLAPIGQ